MKAVEKLAKARTQLVIFQPFWASLILRMEMTPQPEEWFKKHGLQPDITTNGREIYYYEPFIDEQTLGQVQGLLAHEVGHAMLNHATRKDWREDALWNQAADGVLNPILKDSGFELPAEAFTDKELEGKSTEQAYAILEKRACKQPKGGNGPGKGGGKGDGQPPPGSVFSDTNSAAERSHQEQEWQVAVQQAAQAAKQAGNLPSTLERLVDDFKKPKIDWITVLRRFFEETNPADYQWFPVNRRYAAQGDFLPSVKKEGYGKIVIGVDTSGSIDQEMLRQFVSEINAIAEDIKPSETHVIYCDTAVGRHDIFRDGEPVTIAAVGGGGTSFEPVFNYVEKHALEPKCLIYLTDMEGNLNFPEPPYPTLWTTQSTSIVGTFGETLVMPLGGE